jgi:predicted RNA-binding protein YlxR (DUF448 family)
VVPQSELVRLALADGTVVADPGRRLPGRGAYLHRRRECWDRAVVGNALPRAFRRPVGLPSDPLDLSD